MKVLFSSRATLFSVPGGDTIQLVKTAEYLRKLGVSVDFTHDSQPDLNGYDLVHLFNLMRPQDIYVQALNAKRQGKPVALSTIYGLYTEYEKKARPGLVGFVTRNMPIWQIERLKVMGRAINNHEFGRGSLLVAGLGYHRLCSWITKLVDVFLPNSHSEMERVNSDFIFSRNKPFVVVPNAVDTSVFNPKSVIVQDSIKRFEGCILSVARIEGRKSQLELVRAVKGIDVDLVLIGNPAPNHIGYYETIKCEAHERVHFIGQVDHLTLAQYYAVSKVHALVSWMETPGLSSLEAGAMGCNLVITDKGDTRDYFGDDAHYCDPQSVDSIHAALNAALSASPNTGLQSRIISEYTWEKAAEMTLKGYKLAI